MATTSLSMAARGALFAPWCLARCAVGGVVWEVWRCEESVAWGGDVVSGVVLSRCLCASF
jgi:hypothetical protein